jgi:selenoprotein W-related protein
VARSTRCCGSLEASRAASVVERPRKFTFHRGQGSAEAAGGLLRGGVTTSAWSGRAAGVCGPPRPVPRRSRQRSTPESTRVRGPRGGSEGKARLSRDVTSFGGSKVENRIEILFCTQCRWLLRAAWMAQELLTTFDQEISELSLKPGTGGIFEIRANGVLLWSRKEQGRFPEITELKQLVRDHIAPGRDLGHADRQKQGAP